ncbi:hypothetical protein H4J51_07575 [Colwellia sp. MB02u-18]|uniref:hypothetical protein n=1 Tax=unclassified Colwellia TaxID=196834 RepID=UPI0015F762F7|nr:MULTISPECIES: hypothetical protein [unclassified Colwellia]MBA6223280.1 hypothetical protein [Colwellia sp. MB3u-45]MBA6266424.1 hypothetical protein [Colwellia sp. MB3u-43]MBA6322439.1 hypothetical protein [Colwellia sp. MB02u-19]MBA6324438.1 hypothetical protein [Colwellia sp. MB02u-18]MBA6330108.1 hypothetical protein [Colwellia sp. MB02u-12]
MKYIIFVIVITLKMSFSPSLLAKTQHALISSIAQTDASGKKAKKEVNAQKNNTINDEKKAKEEVNTPINNAANNQQKAKTEVNSPENNTTNNEQKAKEGQKAKKAADNKAKTKIVSNNL